MFHNSVMSETVERMNAALADRYTIERELGAGGMATVYLAEDLKHRRKVAVKVLRPELAAALGPGRFLREIEIAAGLTHPHILPLHDSGEADGFLFYVMPYVEGESLRDRLDREKQLPVEEALQIAREVADALGCAHKAGVIHRDIKPENLLLQEGHAVITDFGIARAVDVAGGEQLTLTGMSVGTPSYSSPEQSYGQDDVDGRSDLYSLGCVLYEMLAGEPPFTGPTAQAIVSQHAAAPVPTIRTIRDTVPVHVEDTICRALAKVPADRFSNAKDFVDALNANLAAADSAVGRGGSGRTSILVLPFENFSPESDTEYLSDGLTDEIITDLSGVGTLGVISRTSAMQLKGTSKNIKTIGRELNVQYVLEGTLRKTNSTLRISARLVDTATDELIWSNKFMGPLENVFEIEETIARAIIEALEVDLSATEQQKLAERPIPNVQAFEYYLRAKQETLRFTEDGLGRALKYLQQGIDILGDNVLLQSAMGYAYWQYLNAGVSSDPVYLKKAQECADKIFASEPDSPHGHRLLGLIGLHAGEPQQVIAHLTRALDSDPNDTDALLWLALHLGFAGKSSAGRPLVERLLEIDPLTPFYQMLPGFLSLMEGDFAGACAPFLKAHRLEPGNPIVLLTYGQILAMNQREDEAIKVFDELLHDAPDTFFAQLGNVYKLALSGEREAALEAVSDELRAAAREDLQYSWSLAECFAILDDSDQAIEWLENAVAQNFWNYPLLAEHDPLLANVRNEPRFEELMNRVKELWEALEV